MESQGDSGHFRGWLGGAKVNQIEGWNTSFPVTAVLTERSSPFRNLSLTEI
jgi:hypothetical protein